MSVEQLIYTDRPRGKGVDASLAGYQIKACSEGLGTEARRQLESICMHYGDAVYGAAPRAAKDRETLWRTQAASLDVTPDEVLNEFPVVWSYDRIADDEYALTRVNYSGLTHDGRFGNFFAHALVFNPAQLDQHNFNPVALTCSDLFRGRDDGSDDTGLPSLSDLEVTTQDTGDKNPGVLSQPPYRERLAPLLDALCNATPDTRPVLVTLDDWRMATPLVQALLELLPPSARCRTTFATYESDRTWLIPTAGNVRPSNVAAAHHLLILSSPEARPFNLRPDEYQAVFAVFNFAEKKFSESLPAPGPYAEFAVQCVNANWRNRLRLHHEMIEQLQLGQNPKAWNALVPAVDLLDQQPNAPSLAEIARRIESFARQPASAHKSLSILLPHVRRLAATQDGTGLEQLGPPLSALSDRVATDEELNRTQDFVPAVYELAGKALSEGNAHVAAALLSMCGQARAGILLGLLDDALNDEQAALNPGVKEVDRRATVALTIEGLAQAEQIPEYASIMDQWLRAAFRTARAADLLSDLWLRTADKFVKPRLNTEWDATAEQLARDLAASAPAAQAPEASFWLNLKLLERKPPVGDALLVQLRELAQACSLCEGTEDRARELLSLALSRFTEDQNEMRADIMAQLAEAAHGRPASDIFFDAYRAELERVASGRFKLRRKLAAAGVKHVLSRELIAEVLPWDEDRFQSWWREILRDEHVLDAARRAVAAHMRNAETTNGDTLELAEALIRNAANVPAAGSGLAELYEMVALTLPFEPLSKKWARLKNSLPESQASARLRVMEFMSDVERRSGEPTWSVVFFPHEHKAWTEDLKQLGDEERDTALAWCLEQFADTGITTPQEAAAFVSIWSAAGAGSAEEIGNAMSQLLQERDQVTKVQAIMAFARCVLEGLRQAENYGPLVRALLDNCDRKTRTMFEDHLQRRFARRDHIYSKRLRLLCDVAGLNRPAAPAVRSAAATQSAHDESAAWPNVTGLFGSAKRSWRKILGGSGDKTKPGSFKKGEQ